MNYTGGKAIASGAYGCVFKPALKCKGDKTSPSNMISKLMLTHHANEEYDEIQKFSKIIKKIPNYQNYFLIDPINWCIPEKLSKSDKVDYMKKCSNLKRKNINADNINDDKELAKLRILNIPDGGIDIDDYFKNNIISNEILFTINENIKDLLKNAVIPMNKMNLYHLDLKPGNLLIDSKKQVRIVDWGLSSVINSKKAPNVLKNRPVQFNCPFSTLLINDIFLKEYNAFLKASGKTYKLRLREFVILYYDKWSKQRGTGHEDYIEYMAKNIFFDKMPGIKNQADIIKYNIAKAFIYNYLIVNLETFTEDGKFQEEKFMDVFLHNCDIWGLLMCYEPIFYYARKAPAHITIKPKSEVLNIIMTILLKYCFDNPDKKIPIPSLINDINHINKLLKIPGAKLKGKKPKLKIVEKLDVPKSSATKKKRKRCPNGTRKNKNPPPECLPK